jgi:hypothetical protein
MKTMKTPGADVQNRRIIRVATWLVSLPLVGTLACWAGMKWLCTHGRSGERVRVDDKVRQSRARRTLRGLPPDHVQQQHQQQK